MPKISFIIPIHDMKEYLSRCLSSISNQTDADFEAILVDDRTDSALETLCKEYVNKDSRFIYIPHEKAWLSALRNKGLEIARGEYISFVDSDDYIDPEFIKMLYPRARDAQADLVCFGFKWNIHCGDKIIEEFPHHKMEILTEETMLRHFCLDWLLPQRRNYVWSKLYRKAFLDATGVVFNVDALYCEDRNFCYKLLFQSKRTLYVNETPYFYFQHQKSLTHTAALRSNIFSFYLYAFNDITDYWKVKNFSLFNPVLPIVLLRTLQGVIFNTVQTVNSLEIMAETATQAFEKSSILQVLTIDKLQNAISIYADICTLNWKEQSKIWLFALSILGGKEGIIAWQQLYPGYTALITD